MTNVIATLKHSLHNNELHPQQQPIHIYQEPALAESHSASIQDQQMLPISDTQASPVFHTLPGPETGTMRTTARLLQKTWSHSPTSVTTVKVHVDGGANRSITNMKDYLLIYWNIKKYPMSGVAAGDAALVCTGVGYLPWQSDTGGVVLVKC